MKKHISVLGYAFSLTSLISKDILLIKVINHLEYAECVQLKE